MLQRPQRVEAAKNRVPTAQMLAGHGRGGRTGGSKVRNTVPGVLLMRIDSVCECVFMYQNSYFSITQH